MKLLFDENLSPRLVNALADVFPDLSAVQRLGWMSYSMRDKYQSHHQSDQAQKETDRNQPPPLKPGIRKHWLIG